MVRQEVMTKAEKIKSLAEKVLAENKKSLRDEEIFQGISQMAEESFLAEEILGFLKVLRGIEKNNFAKWGFSHWPEIKPKGTREKIHLILKEKNKPLHFRQIAQLMDEYKLNKRKAHPQTIHNELIKNDKFVLIGRGIYALRDWGYSRGTVKDVLQELFLKTGKPLTKEEILAEISKIRKVKKATIMINLGNRNLFIKEGNRYFLKK